MEVGGEESKGLMHTGFYGIENSNKRIHILMGGGGAGKSETAINLALELTKKVGNIHFFDMDQTKPLFRSRDIKGKLQDSGVSFHNGNEFLDAPVVPDAVIETVETESNTIIMDTGADAKGIRCLGQFKEYLGRAETNSYFLINYFRPFSQKSSAVRDSIENIKKIINTEDILIISNPNLGADTTLEHIKYGHEKLVRTVESIGYRTCCLLVSAEFYKTVREAYPGTCIFPVRLYL